MSSYLLNRNGCYHVRIRVPSDLSTIIPAAELVKSLKTRDKSTAKVAALPYCQTILKTFSLLRTGFISGEQGRASIDRLLNRKSYFKALAVDPMPEPCLLSPKPSAGTLRLSKLITQYTEDRQHAWTPKSKMENNGSCRLILDLLGDIEVSSIDRLVVRDLRGKLLMLPSNIYKLFPKQTALQVLNMMKDSPQADVSPMSITTVNKHVSRFSSLLKHCIKEGYITVNPAVGLKVRQKRRTDEERKAYSVDDIQRVVANLPTDENKPERYWIPLIGMYSGLRLDEACQLYTEDVKEVDGVWCFDVNDNLDKKVKTESSKRTIPVHPELIRLGILAHVNKMQQEGQPRLWMNLHWRKEDGYGNSLGKWFQRFNRRHVTVDSLKTFHSFRHAFADTLKQLGEQESLISELMGHANGNITTGRYGKRYKPCVLLEAVSKLTYSPQ
jgi:integrase